MNGFTETQQMLCLAALTYRDFADVGPPSVHAQRLHDDIGLKLQQLEPVRGQWALVWGPASYRSAVSLFDDAAMFVVQNTVRPNQYAIAVRGTNPVSAFDWVFGDLWVSGQVPWPFDDTKAARISLSTALGLDVLLQLRAGSPPASSAALVHLEGHLRDFAGELKTIALKPLRSDAVKPIRDNLGQHLADLLSRRTGLPAQDREAQVKSFRVDWSPEVRKALIASVAAGLNLLGGQPSLHVLALLEKTAWVEARLSHGNDLVTFLKAAVASASGPVDLVVTGHSKGGALAPTLALWLAETQGAASDEAFRWDPASRATVGCYSFAGPTAGNAAFAMRSNERIGARCHRIFNPFDVVPKAWTPQDMVRIAKLYDAAVVKPIPGLEALASGIADVVDTEKLGYTHIGNDVQELPGALDTSKREFALQLVHQHLQAYLDTIGIGDVVSVDTFFNPLR